MLFQRNSAERFKKIMASGPFSFQKGMASCLFSFLVTFLIFHICYHEMLVLFHISCCYHVMRVHLQVNEFSFGEIISR